LLPVLDFHGLQHLGNVEMVFQGSKLSENFTNSSEELAEFEFQS
jgi:hypothetical protein